VPGAISPAKFVAALAGLQNFRDRIRAADLHAMIFVSNMEGIKSTAAKITVNFS
jgi:hypothetical protein